MFTRLIGTVFLLCFVIGVSQQQQQRCPSHNNVDEFLHNPERFIVNDAQLINGVDILDLTCLNRKMATNFFKGPLAHERIGNLSRCLLSDFVDLDINCYEGYLIMCQGITRHIPEEGTDIRCDFQTCSRARIRLLRHITGRFVSKGGPDLVADLVAHMDDLRERKEKLACLSKPFVINPQRLT